MKRNAYRSVGVAPAGARDGVPIVAARPEGVKGHRKFRCPYFVVPQFIAFPYGVGEWWDVVVPWSIVAAGTASLIWQLRVWLNLSRAGQPGRDDMTFLRRRCFRRAQIAFLLLVLGIFLLAGRMMFPDTRHPGWAIIYWAVTMLLALWLMVLAAADLMIGVLHFSQLKHRSDLEQIRLTLLADRIKRLHGNGKPRPAKKGEAHDTEKKPEG